eukprot:m.104738 g.104738  ORF g.104738 m.104738 type:complete len:330 (-) comp27591_c1_seq1:156-1145(-)
MKVLSTLFCGVVLATTLLASSTNAQCVTFWAGLCPGAADCECTTGAACTADGVNDTRPAFVKEGGCAGRCRKVVHNECSGNDRCLKDVGPCDGPSPPPPHPPSPPSPHPPAPPSGEEPKGPDVSSYQGRVSWSSVKAAGAGFGIAKATEGETVTDGEFASNWASMRSVGMGARGAYHFAHPGESASTQASHFVKTVGHLGHGEFYVLDIESATSKLRASGNWTKEVRADVAAWCVSFVNEVMSLSGVGKNRVWIYTGAWFWDPDAGGSSALSAHPLWVSGYSAEPPIPKGWLTWTMWQYTDKGDWAGVNGACDSSKFHGTQAELELLVA